VSGRAGASAPPLGALLLGLAWPAPAAAHLGTDLGEFYAGLIHPFLHFDSALPLLAAALWIGQLAASSAWKGLVALAGGLCAGVVAGLLGLGGGAWSIALRLGALGLGGAVAARLRPPEPWVLAVLGAVGALLGGFAGFEVRADVTRPLLFGAGLLAGAGAGCVYVGGLLARFERFWVQVGVRVLGSWIAAVGLLVSALDWARRGR
jgi:urease accessory protein